MPPGKLASQAGHAFCGSLCVADENRRKEYHKDGIGTKICLVAESLDQLQKLCHRANELGIPHVLIEDTGRNTTFGGVPTVSAAGFGPIAKSEFPPLKRLQLLP